MAKKTSSSVVLAMRLVRQADAQGRPWDVTLARCSQVPDSLRRSIYQPNVQADKYCRQTYKNTGNWELAKFAHQTRQVFEAVPQNAPKRKGGGKFSGGGRDDPWAEEGGHQSWGAYNAGPGTYGWGMPLPHPAAGFPPPPPSRPSFSRLGHRREPGGSEVAECACLWHECWCHFDS